MNRLCMPFHFPHPSPLHPHPDVRPPSTHPPPMKRDVSAWSGPIITSDCVANTPRHSNTSITDVLYCINITTERTKIKRDKPHLFSYVVVL